MMLPFRMYRAAWAATMEGMLVLLLVHGRGNIATYPEAFASDIRHFQSPLTECGPIISKFEVDVHCTKDFAGAQDGREGRSLYCG